MRDIFKIAIDGPSGAGKSTVAKALAAKLGVHTALILGYLALSWKIIRK